MPKELEKSVFGYRDLKMQHILVKTFLFFLFSPLFCIPLISKEKEAKKPLSVVIVGAGPSGLFAAIEAKQVGAHVTVVEKRSVHSRRQWLILFDSSIKLLQKWHIEVPQMQLVAVAEGGQIGFVPIAFLEEGLEKTIKLLGVQKIQGEFKALKTHKITILTEPQGEELDLSYDILVGADGTHSQVRKSLAIEDCLLGSAFGFGALIQNPENAPEKAGVLPPVKWGDFFLSKLWMPTASILFMQGPHVLSKLEFQKALEDMEWFSEARAVAADKARIFFNVEVFLRQAKTFSNREKSTILIGDAAATASFFQGMGANTALKTAEIAGRFFKEMQEESKTAYEDFNREMQEATDLLIEDSQFLF